MDQLKQMLMNDSVFKTFFDPESVIECRTPTISILKLLFPLFLQCSFLHPQLSQKRSSRHFRLALVPISFYCALKISVDYCFTPLDRSGVLNLVLGCCGIHLALKSFEWGFVGQDEMVNYHTRPEFLESDEDTPTEEDRNQPENGEMRSMDGETVGRENQKKHQLTWKDLYVWNADQFASPRGLQYGWGAHAKPNGRSALDVMKRMMKVHLVHLVSVAYSVHTRDSGSASKALRALGVPASFPGLYLFAEGLSTLAFGLYLVSLTDIGYSYYTLFGHFIKNINPRFTPKWFRSYFNLKLYVPLYDNPHKAASLAELWSKKWHQAFRRSFVVCGALPARKLVRAVGLGRKAEKIASVFGCFIVSGIMHELAIHFIARKPHPDPHLFFKKQEFPGSLLYFLAQPIGMMIEPMVLKYVPKSAWLWLFGFTIPTATPFRHQWFGSKNRLLDRAYPSISDWDWISLIVPGGMLRFW